MKQLVISLIIFLLSLSVLASSKTLFNKDNGYPQLITFENKAPGIKNKQSNRTKEEIALQYARDHRNLFGLSDASQLKIIRIQQSLLGTHYTLSQYLDDIPVTDANLVISIDEDKTIYKVFSSLQPNAEPNADFTLTKGEALQKAWVNLHVHGPLLSLPTVEQVYIRSKAESIAGYRVQMICSKPYGSWIVDVDGSTGEILSKRQLARKMRHEETNEPVDEPIWTVERAMANLNQKAARKFGQLSSANGTALVFDPDPRTTLLRDDLRDSSDFSEFDDAYEQRQLKDITHSGIYELIGPYAQIADIEPPNTPPSTSESGNWTAKRGNLAFYDTMCYYHVDTCQRYVQSLGFTGVRGVMDDSLEIDSNGQYGADNSAFIYSYNSDSGRIYNEYLTFGQGGVPDDEDADVIIHEYGHALNFDIVGNFSGGDTGAIAEGFSDYWAASYRLRLNNGLAYHPAWVFHWDGHSPLTWRGRYLNAYSAVYNPGSIYYAHYPIANGWVTDELWSTPVFQALLSAVAQGYPKEDMDAIMLESFFGMGPGTTIPQQATAIVQVAERLHPHKPYATILTENFARHGILSHASNYQYIASHIPPSGDQAVAWQSEINLTNTQNSSIQVQVTLYEKSASGFQVRHSRQIAIQPYSSVTYTPIGSDQRWAVFECSQELTGTLSFFRTVNDSKTEERVSMPLVEKNQLEQHLLYPHVPEHRSRFWSGGVLLNPTPESLTLEYRLIGVNGRDLTHLMSPSAPSSLQPYEKYVTYFADQLFDDSESNEKVSYLEVTANGELAGFELFGYQPEETYSATSGITATSFFNRPYYVARNSLYDTDWSGFVLVNPFDYPISCTINVIDASGIERAFQQVTLRAKEKVMGLNDKNSGFTFPYGNGSQTMIDLNPGLGISWVVVTSEAPFKLFELAGDHAATTLDGTAVWGNCTEAHFTRTSGTLEVINGPLRGRIAISAKNANGEEVFGLTPTLNAWEPITMDLSSYDVASLSITGESFFAYLVENDTENGSLTIRGATTNP
ncbi:MAG: hypothetical protein CR997_05960 [Acidobacteria bacterium]|nr:MAG: hypothetical protein CR997_05960 [Acidobacteriota bacterium]